MLLLSPAIDGAVIRSLVNRCAGYWISGFAHPVKEIPGKILRSRPEVYFGQPKAFFQKCLNRLFPECPAFINQRMIQLIRQLFQIPLKISKINEHSPHLALHFQMFRLNF